MPTTADTIQSLEKAVADAKKRLLEARKALPPEPVTDYTLAWAPGGAPVKLSQLFGAKQDLILIQNMGRKCVYCTLWADGFSGLYKHFADRAAFVLSSPDEAAVAGAFASARHWPFPVVSIAGTTMARDLGFADDKHPVLPGVSVFSRGKDGTVVRVGRSAPFGPGDDFCSLWPMLDLLKDGLAGWEPKYHYV